MEIKLEVLDNSGYVTSTLIASTPKVTLLYNYK